MLETLDTPAPRLPRSLSASAKRRAKRWISNVLPRDSQAPRKSSAALRGLPELARRIHDLDAVILQRGVEEKTIIVFPVLAGLLAEPIFLRFAELSSEPRSVKRS